MSRTDRIARLAIVVGLEAGALAWLLYLGRHPWLQIRWSDLGTWIRVSAPEDAIAAFVWLAALGCVIWLAGSTLLYLAARLSRVPVLIRSVAWMTLPAIRRVTKRALGAILVASNMAATPVKADPPPPVIVLVETDGTLLPPGIDGQMPDAPQEVVGPIDASVPPLPAFPSDTRAGVNEDLPAEVTVRAGDNLWVMCRRRLTDARGRRPTNEEIAPYWRRVIAHNQPNLISGDADLIYAGEVIEMPPAD
jgi:hypothetical protein